MRSGPSAGSCARRLQKVGTLGGFFTPGRDKRLSDLGVFAGKEVEDISSFISGYRQLLVKMYQYQICLKKMHEYSEQFSATLDKAEEAVKELNCK